MQRPTYVFIVWCTILISFTNNFRQDIEIKHVSASLKNLLWYYAVYCIVYSVKEAQGVRNQQVFTVAFRGYPLDRYHFTRVIKYGIPQGTILDTTLFLMCVNNLVMTGLQRCMMQYATYLLVHSGDDKTLKQSK